MIFEERNVETAVQSITGPVPPGELGVTLGMRALLGIVPGAELAPENDCSMLTLFSKLRDCLTELHGLGIRTVVDRGGMTLGRDLYLYEVLSQQTNVNIIGSTGMSEQTHVGSHFTSPTSMHLKPAKPLQDEELSLLYSAEVRDGMVIPRVCRSSRAGTISVGASRTGLTDFEAKSLRAAAQTALQTGTSVVLRTGTNPLAELDVIVGQGLDASRVLLANIDRHDVKDSILGAVAAGASISIDNAGRTRAAGFLDDAERIDTILELAAAGYSGRIVIGTDGYGHAVGMPDMPVPVNHIMGNFVPALRANGASPDLITAILATNTHRIITPTGSTLSLEESK